MDETTVSCIDPHMIDVETVDAEEDQVTWRECIHGHRPGLELLFTRGSWNLNTGALVGIDRKSAAVKALQVRATEVIGRADELRGGACDRESAVPGRLLQVTRDTGTGRQQQNQSKRGERVAQESFLSHRSARRSLEEAGGQPAARMSLMSGLALIVRAWRSSVTACADRGRARKKPWAISQRRSRRKSSCSAVSMPSATTRLPRA